ncbi:hypothetical protein CANARDRAFT_30609 [[Candida] arabinofermentans NRRL YB-2248]|uniref:LCCL domain-containing protein n=1 Tax=[Candida] arabinofermentans NRRL YB-2248 TaxID=983967 RepID=A0A1E4STC7_9ASCO|nr:hypothetical protein CANARDRAFT_30609 [[Candida] arabinofermentans NRRL YB-2248]
MSSIPPNSARFTSEPINSTTPPTSSSTFTDDVELQSFIIPDENDDRLKSDNQGSGAEVDQDADSIRSFEADDYEPKSKFSSLKKVSRKISMFCKHLWLGPSQPEDNPPRFTSEFINQFENFPTRISTSFPAKIKIPFVLLYYTFWLLMLRSSVLPYLTEQSTYENTETGETKDIISLTCRGEASIWKGKNAQCGLDGKKCGPFEDREVIFRCPALCDSESVAYSSLTVGDENVKYISYYVGGGKNTVPETSDALSLPYRADSYPCGAAIHAGVISPYLGGCVRMKFTGEQFEFPSKKSQYSTNPSVGFDSFFPASFKFFKFPEESVCHNCKDPRVLVALINIVLGIPVIFMSTSGTLAYWTIAASGFWTIVLIFDPPRLVRVQDPESLPSLISLGFERFLPLTFILFTVWRISVQTTLESPSSPVCKTLIWYPLFWVGMLNNVTFDRLPVDRLTIQDIKTQPGAIGATLLIVGIITFGVFAQAYQLWKAGKFRKYLGIYLGFIVLLFVLANLKGLNLRVHHYILALLLIPGTNTKGFTAMLFQGVLLGLLVNGVARWGLASVEETNRSLRRSDPSGQIKPPSFIGYEVSNSSISWANTDSNDHKMIDGEVLAPSDKLDKFSLLINDIERYNGVNTSVSLDELMRVNEEFSKEIEGALKYEGYHDNDDDGDDSEKNVKLYFRIAKTSGKNGKTGDYTKAAVLEYPSGKFKSPESGLT